MHIMHIYNVMFTIKYHYYTLMYVRMYSRSLSTVAVSSPLGLAGTVTTIVLLFTYNVLVMFQGLLFPF